MNHTLIFEEGPLDGSPRAASHSWVLTPEELVAIAQDPALFPAQ